METTTEATTATNPARAPRALSLSGRRRQRAAGERISAFFEEHGRMVYGVCRLILRDGVEAEDAAQQTFLSAYGSLLAGQEPREPAAWLGTIARNECRSRLRGRRTEALTLVREPAGDELQRDLDRHEEIQALCSALAELPVQQREAIVLREFYGLSYAEVAAALGLSGAAVESLLFRSRKRLQEQLRPARSMLGMLTLPISLRDSLAHALPGFGGGGASAGAGAAVIAKLASGPVAAKVAAATLAVGAAGTLAGFETTQATRHRQAPTPAPKISVASKSAPVRLSAPIPVALTTSAPPTAPVVPKPSNAEPKQHERDGSHSGSGTGGEGDSAPTEQEHGGSGRNDGEPAGGGDSGDKGDELDHSGSGDSGSGDPRSGDSGTGDPGSDDPAEPIDPSASGE